MMPIDSAGLVHGWTASMKKIVAGDAPAPTKTANPFTEEQLSARAAELLLAEQEDNRLKCLWCFDQSGECFCTRVGCTSEVPCPALDGPMSAARQPIPTFQPKDTA